MQKGSEICYLMFQLFYSHKRIIKSIQIVRQLLTEAAKAYNKVKDQSISQSSFQVQTTFIGKCKNEKDINAHNKAKATPIAADPEKITRNDPKDLKNESVCAVTDL